MHSGERLKELCATGGGGGGVDEEATGAGERLSIRSRHISNGHSVSNTPPTTCIMATRLFFWSSVERTRVQKANYFILAHPLITQRSRGSTK